VSLRRLALPLAPEEQQQRLLRLQIESEFPLPPEQLAWGTLPLDGQPTTTVSDPSTREIFVCAVRRELIEEYQSLLVASGLDPVFTLAAVARAHLCPRSPDRWSLLDVQPGDAELVVFDQGVPSSIQILPWGSEAVLSFPAGGSVLNRALLGTRLYLSGADHQEPRADEVVRQAVGPDVTVQPIPPGSSNAPGAALRGLESLLEQGHPLPALILQADSGVSRTAAAAGAFRRWGTAAAVLALGFLLLRYIETAAEQSHLANAINEVRSYRESLPLIDQQLNFHQYLQTNRHPYLRIIAAVAKSASPGMQLESVSLNRRGDLLLRGSLQARQPPTDFRTKLVESGAFTSVVLEEQNPGQRQQKITFRIAARWNPESVRDLPELPPVEKKPGTVGAPGMPRQSFSPPVMPMPSSVPLGPGMPPEVVPSQPGMPIETVIGAEGLPVTPAQIEPENP
jgi:hypothetical protein